MISCTIRGVRLNFELEHHAASSGRMARVTLVVYNPAIPGAKYDVVSIFSNGTLMRHPGLPSGWGFRLTMDRKIKEIY